MSAMQNILHRLEAHLMRGAKETALVLGVAYSTYAAFKAGTRPVPRYVAGHAEVLIVLPLDRLHEIVRSRLGRKGKKA